MRKFLKCSACAVAFATLAIGSSRARGTLIIQPVDSNGVPGWDTTISGASNATAIEGAITTAIAKYSTLFTNNLTVPIDFQENNSGLGESQFSLYQIPYATFRTALAAETQNPAVATALAHLPVQANDPITVGASSTTMYMKPANALALGLGALIGGAPTSDGTILLNTTITSPGITGTSGAYPLIPVIQHEVDEILGLGSSLEDNSTYEGFPNAEDFYRYTSAGARSLSATSTVISYFSIDGTHDLAQFDNQADGGDYGDWQSNPLPNGVAAEVQDAFGSPGGNPSLGTNEITALEAIGFVPEPSSAALLAVGGVVALRRRRATKSQ